MNQGTKILAKIVKENERFLRVEDEEESVFQTLSSSSISFYQQNSKIKQHPLPNKDWQLLPEKEIKVCKKPPTPHKY